MISLLVAIACLDVLVRVKASRYENLPRRLNKYLANMIEEQRKKAQNRLSWHYVDEIVRPDTLNRLFEEEINAMQDLPGLGKDMDGNRDAYVSNLRAYLPIAEARYIDNAVRTVTTHIMDVPKGSRMTRLDSEEPPTYSFQAPQLYEEGNLKHLMKLRHEISDKPEDLLSKVKVLEELHDALLTMCEKPTSQAVAQAQRVMQTAQMPQVSKVTQTPMVPLASHPPAEERVPLDAVQVRKLATVESAEEAELFESVSSETPSLMDKLRVVKIFSDPRKSGIRRSESRRHKNR